MTDRPVPTDTPDETPRPMPAPVGSVVDLRAAPPTALPGPGSARNGDSAHPAVESTLVGAGDGLPAMAPRARDEGPHGAGGTAPLRMESRPAIATDSPAQGDAGPAADRAETSVKPSSLPPVAPPAAAPSASRSVPESRPAPQPESRRGGFFPLFLGGVTAACLGAGAATWAIPRLPAGWLPAASAPTAPAAPAGLDAAMTEAASKAGAEAAARLLAEAPATAQPDAGLAATLAAQAEQLAALDKRLAELSQQPPAAIDIAPLQQQIDALAQRPVLDPATVQRLTAESEAATARIKALTDEAEARLREAEGRTAELTPAADQAARHARAAAAAAALGEAVQTGAPRTQALAQLTEAGVEPPAALTAEIPPLDALAAEFPAAARAALRADLKARSAQGQGSIVGNFLRAQTGARSVAPRDGADADAVLSRAGDALQRGAVAQALKELESLPEPARPAMADWIARAQSLADAQTALDQLTAPVPAPVTAAPAPASPAPAAPPAASAPAASN